MAVTRCRMITPYYCFECFSIMMIVCWFCIGGWITKLICQQFCAVDEFVMSKYRPSWAGILILLLKVLPTKRFFLMSWWDWGIYLFEIVAPNFERGLPLAPAWWCLFIANQSSFQFCPGLLHCFRQWYPSTYALSLLLSTLMSFSSEFVLHLSAWIFRFTLFQVIALQLSSNTEILEHIKCKWNVLEFRPSHRTESTQNISGRRF